MFNSIIKTAWRNFTSNKTFLFLNVFGLAIGIACAGFIFLWTEDELNWDNNHIKKNQLYSVRVNSSYNGNLFTNGSTPRVMAASILNDIPGIANTCRMSDEPQQALFSTAEKSAYASGRYADPSLFSMFTFNFVQGDSRNAFKDLYSLVLTESSARKFFGTDNPVVGQHIRMDNEQDYRISGIIKDPPKNSSLQFEWIAPYEVSILQLRKRWGVNDSNDWSSYGPFTFVELKRDANPELINSQLRNYIHKKNDDETNTSFLFSMNDWHLYDEFNNGKQTGGGLISEVRLLSTIGWIIVLIACINFMNLATARSQKRSREVGIRKVLGSRRNMLIFQFMAEALFACTLATITAIMIISLALPAFNELVQKQLVLALHKPEHLIALSVIVLICGVVAGSYPSLYLSSFRPIEVLKAWTGKAGSATAIRKLLVVTQFSISIVFIISTAVVYLQIEHVKNRNLGFNKNNLIEIPMQQDVSGIFSAVRQDLLATGSVQSAAMTDHRIISGGNTDDRFKWEGKPDNSSIAIAHRTVTSDFISVTGLQLSEGRNFSPDAASNHIHVIVNRSLAKLMGEGSAVGKIIQSPRGQKEGEYKNMTVIGVVNDHLYGNVYGTPGPMLYFCAPPTYGHLIYTRIKPTSDISASLAKIEKVIKKHNPSYPFEYRFVDEQFHRKFDNEQSISKLSTLFAGLSIIISCLGLFGLAAYTAERRIKEIGIRKVLGASVAGIVRLLTKDFLQLVIISCLVSFPVAWWVMHDWLNNYEYRINISWWIFLIAGAIAIVIALFTISFQAVRAGIANPVKNLRSE